MSSQQHPAWYDEDRADEAALALLWLGAGGSPETDTIRASSHLPDEIFARLRQRGLIVGATTASLTFTEVGATRAANAFEHLLGKPNPASIAPQPETHIVDEIDGD